ncbi:MAG: asparagine synthase (glutamine-hydrolyzing) [Alphaproteobacteria bacterium]|nr:asparagine synthase (glutamine-hydrolyzing) [Alphaproteobacteria bacterium]
MCGIAGFVGPGSLADLARMCGALAHRGPDAAGYWQSDGGPHAVALGARRLVILDRAGGSQPLALPDGGAVLVFNGEIYNHRELRRELEGRGHRFRSDHSDTEVVLNGYAAWGTDLVRRLNGMFSFALYDHRLHRLVLATDPFGKKPLYYAERADGFAFASELSALRRNPTVGDAIDGQGLRRFLAFGFVPAPATLLKGVRKMHGGEVLVHRIAERTTTSERYWRYRVTADARGSPADWAAELRDLLAQAVARRLESDVPLGFFLSGGIDSATVLALAGRAGGDRPPSFTIGFSEPSYDESHAAAAVAARLGSAHHVETLTLAHAEGLVGEVLGRIDEPLADPSLVPTYLLSRFARRHVTVALSGDGGDELFAGYTTFGALPLAVIGARVPGAGRRLLRQAADWLPRQTTDLSFDFKLRRALRGLDHVPGAWHPAWLAPAGLDEITALTGQRVVAEDVYGDVIALWEAGRDSVYDRALEYYGNVYLPYDILPKIDRASMLCSLEVRSPFLDRDLTAFVSRLPYRAKHGMGVRKRLLRAAMADLLPAAVLRRPKKGFGMPIAAWLRRWPHPEPARARDLGLDGDWLVARWEEHRAGAADHRGLLWAWLCLDRWQANRPAPRARTESVWQESGTA